MVAPVTKLLMAFGMPWARKGLNWCRVLVPQTPFRGLAGPSSFSDPSLDSQDALYSP